MLAECQEKDNELVNKSIQKIKYPKSLDLDDLWKVNRILSEPI